MVSAQPESCRIAFKEWASVCDALLDGRQAIILRKGGISEGPSPGVFVPEHSEFWLYPTWVHQAEQGVRGDFAPSPATQWVNAEQSVLIRGLVRVDLTVYLESEQSLRALAEHHILTAQTVSKRFHYRKPGLWVMGARVFRVEPSHSIAVTPEHAGCKTWVELDESLSTSRLIPVFSDDAWVTRRRSLRDIVGGAIS